MIRNAKKAISYKITVYVEYAGEIFTGVYCGNLFDTDVPFEFKLEEIKKQYPNYFKIEYEVKEEVLK